MELFSQYARWSGDLIRGRWEGIEHRAWSMGFKTRNQRTDERGKQGDTVTRRRGDAAKKLERSDIRGLRSGIKLISDLRLLTSAINGF